MGGTRRQQSILMEFDVNWPNVFALTRTAPSYLGRIHVKRSGEIFDPTFGNLRLFGLRAHDFASAI